MIWPKRFLILIDQNRPTVQPLGFCIGARLIEAPSASSIATASPGRIHKHC